MRKGLVLALVLCAYADGALAQRRPPVRWAPDACARVDLAVARRVLGVELQELLLADGDPADGALRLTLICDDDGATLRAFDGAEEPVLSRALPWSSLPDTPRARGRTVALVAVEVTFLVWARGPQRPAAPVAPPTPAPSPSPPPPPARPVARSVAPQDRPRWSVGLLTSVRGLSRGGLLWGAAVGLRHDRPSGLSLAIDLGAWADDPTGASRSAWEAGVGAGVVTPWDRWRFRLDAGLRAALIVTDGAPEARVWLSPYLRVGATARLVGGLHADVAGVMGVGLAASPEASTEPFEGVWCGAQLGLSWWP